VILDLHLLRGGGRRVPACAARGSGPLSRRWRTAVDGASWRGPHCGVAASGAAASGAAGGGGAPSRDGSRLAALVMPAWCTIDLKCPVSVPVRART